MQMDQSCSVTRVTISSLILTASALTAHARGADDRVKMRLEVEVEASRVVVGENFPVTIRVVNPNPVQVDVRGFLFAYDNPMLEVSLDGGESFICIHIGPDYWSNNRDVLSAPAKGSVSFTRLLYHVFDDERWPMEPGVCYLRSCQPGTSGRRQGEENWVRVDWESVPVRIDVRGPSALDRRAWQFMAERLKTYGRRNRAGTAEPLVAFREQLYTEFLERFPESVYAPEIKWHLAKVLARRLGHHDVPEEEAARERWAALLKECLGFCLERGGPYAEPFVTWEPNARPFGPFQYALSSGLFEVGEMLADALDRRYPDDAAAKRYRRGLIAYFRGSMGKAQEHFEVVEKEFPESPYAEDARRMQRSIEEKRQADDR